MSDVSEPSKAAVKKAGDRLRRLRRNGPLDMRDPSTFAAYQTAVSFRATHMEPLNHTALALRALVRSIDDQQSHFGHRLKRMARIIEKVAIHGTALHRLQDIGGCRIVVADVAHCRQVADAVEARFECHRRTDYFAEPRESGYRAIHMVLSEQDRLIELQIRTTRQHYWAEMVEAGEIITGYPLKDGEGPAELLGYFSVAAELLGLEDSGKLPDDELVRELSGLREQIRPYYRRTGDTP